MKTIGYALLVAALLAACGKSTSDGPPTSSSASRSDHRVTWLKGQLHAHTSASADSDTPAEEVVRWYAEHGFDFVVLTDHNRVTTPSGPLPLLVVPGVELTQQLRTCEPPPLPGEACLLHLNALFTRTGGDGAVSFDEPSSLDRAALYGRAIDHGRELGGLLQLNHPNFHHAVDASLVIALAKQGVTLIEVANQAVDSGNDGDGTHPSTEALWDAALGAGLRVYATASDDAHHYGDAAFVAAHGGTAYVGDRGFVMVHASSDPKSVRAALEGGDFYASTGVILARVELSWSRVFIAAQEEATFELVGDGGALLARSHGLSLEFAPSSTSSGYVRVRVRARDGRFALTQPVFRDATRK